jgi:hypothetical protein
MVGTVSVQKSSKHLFTSMNNSPLLDISECQCIGHLETLAVQCPRVISGSCTLIADFFKHPRSKRLMALDSKRNIVSGPFQKLEVDDGMSMVPFGSPEKWTWSGYGKRNLSLIQSYDGLCSCCFPASFHCFNSITSYGSMFGLQVDC